MILQEDLDLLLAIGYLVIRKKSLQIEDRCPGKQVLSVAHPMDLCSSDRYLQFHFQNTNYLERI